MKLSKKSTLLLLFITNLLFCDIKFTRLEFEKYQEKKIQEKGEILEIPKIEYKKEEDLIKELKENGVKIENFTIWPNRKTPKMKTECFMGYGEKEFYFYLKTEKNKKYNLKARKYETEEGNIWYDDNFEIFLYPVDMEGIYFQIIINPLGEKYDSMWYVKEEFDPLSAVPTIKKEKKSNDKWDSKSIIKTKIGDDYWECLIKIPFSNLGYEFSPGGTLWRINICRSYRETNELVQWAITSEKGFHEPEKFKLVKIGKEKDIKIEFEMATVGYGENLMSIKYQNKTNKDAKGELFVEIKKDGEVLYKDRKEMAIKKGKGEKEIDLPILLKGEGELNCVLKIGEDFYYYKKFINIPAIMKLNLEDTTFIYEGEKSIEGNITLKLGGGSIKKSYLRFEIEDENGKKESKNVQLKGNILKFNLDTSNFKKGQYILTINLIENGKLLETYKTKIFVVSKKI